MISPVRGWISVVALLLCACSSSEPPPLTIVSVTPQRASTSECILLTVELDGPLPVKLDYGSDSAELTGFAQVSVAGRDVQVREAENLGRRLVAHLYEGLPVGVHDVRVTLQDGEKLVRKGALEITPPLVLDTFQIDPIGPQLRQEPFPITIRAVGPDAQRFEGRVLLRSNKGTLEPEWSNPFQQGVVTQQVSIDATGGFVFIEMFDCARRMVTSNEFRLDPRP